MYLFSDDTEMSFKDVSPLQWTGEHVKDWLTANNHSKFAYLFCDQHAIDGKALLLLTESDLRSSSLGIQVCFQGLFV